MKLFAAAVIVAAGYLLGGAAAETRRRAYLQARGVLRLLYSLRTGIDYTRADLFSVFAQFSDPALEECGFLGELMQDVDAGRGWERACGRLSPQTPMLAEIRSLGAGLGMSDAETQIALLSKLASRLEESVEETRRELSAKASSYRLLGALAGCMAAVIIY